jgi:hypothetical protein
MSEEPVTTDPTPVVAVTGYVGLRDLSDAVRTCVRRGERVVVVDLREADSMTRAALGRMVVLNRAARRRGCELRLLCAPRGAAVARRVLAGCGPSVHDRLGDAVGR